MKESKRHIDKNVKFYEPMLSAADVIANGGVITDVTFDNGVGTFNATSSAILYSNKKIKLKSVNLLINLDTTTEDILKLSSTHSITVSSGTISANGFSSPTIYVDDVITSTITTGWHLISVTTTTEILADDISFGYISSYGGFQLDYCTIYNKALSSEEISALNSNLLYTPPSTEDAVLHIPVLGSIYDTKGNVITNNGVDVVRDGSKDVMEFDSSASELYNGTANWRSEDSSGTISAWVKRTSATVSYYFSSSSELTTTQFITIAINATGNLALLQRNNDALSNIVGVGVLGIDEWYHGVIVSTGTEYKIYVNGVLQSLTGSGANNGDWFADTDGRDNFTIGTLHRSTITYSKVNIGDIKILSTPWTAEEIAREFNSTKAKYNL